MCVSRGWFVTTIAFCQTIIVAICKVTTGWERDTHFLIWRMQIFFGKSQLSQCRAVNCTSWLGSIGYLKRMENIRSPAVTVSQISRENISVMLKTRVLSPLFAPQNLTPNPLIRQLKFLETLLSGFHIFRGIKIWFH